VTASGEVIKTGFLFQYLNITPKHQITRSVELIARDLVR